MFHKDNSKKNGRTPACKNCQKQYRVRDEIKERKRQYCVNNRDEIKEYHKQYRVNNRDKIKKNCKQYYVNNRNKIKERREQYCIDNPDKIKETNRQYRANHPDKRNACGARRRAVKRQACPPWTKLSPYKEQIEAVYTNAKWLEDLSGEPYSVDHIVPLKSDFVCGLHVPSNLQPLPFSENSSKGNYYWPGQLPCQQGRGFQHLWWKELKNKMDKEESQCAHYSS